MFADGATTGARQALRNSFATGFPGMRTPIVFRPALAIIGTFSPFLNTIVRGPGKKRPVNLRALAGISDVSSAICSISATCAIRGLSAGRRFASNILEIACSSKIAAPKPYTVSVGNATILPSRIYRAATSGECVSSVFTEESFTQCGRERNPEAFHGDLRQFFKRNNSCAKDLERPVYPLRKG